MGRRASIQQLGRAGRRRIRRVTYAFRRHRARGDFDGSADYWDRRYRLGSDSGAGSYGRTAVHKAAFLNTFVAEHHVPSVIEFGCGDGHQLSLAEYPRYVGLDVSSEAVRACQARSAVTRRSSSRSSSTTTSSRPILPSHSTFITSSKMRRRASFVVFERVSPSK